MVGGGLLAVVVAGAEGAGAVSGVEVASVAGAGVEAGGCDAGTVEAVLVSGAVVWVWSAGGVRLGVVVPPFASVVVGEPLLSEESVV